MPGAAWGSDASLEMPHAYPLASFHSLNVVDLLQPEFFCKQNSSGFVRAPPVF